MGIVRLLKKNLPLFLPVVLSLAVFLPLAFLVGGSLMGKQEILYYMAGEERAYSIWRLLPRFPTLRSYVELLLDSPGFFVMFWNSVKLAAGTLAGQLLVSAPAAWWFARTNRRWGSGLFTLYVVLMLMPFQVTMVSNYLVLDTVNLLNTHWAILLPGIFSTFPVFLIYRFFRDIPQATIEAAEIDGANGLQIFLRVGVPMGSAGVASAMVLGFLEAWNLIEQPMIFLEDKSLWPLSLFLPQISADGMGLALAASVVTLLPSLLVFFCGQSYLEQGITASSVKE